MAEIKPNTAAARGAARLKLKSTAHISASKQNVVQQAKLLDSAGTAWHAVKYGNLEMITRLFPSQCNVYSKGPVGDNVFHIALLLNTPSTLAIAKYLVKLYGKTLVNTPYQERKHEHDPPGQYEGETALHIAIVNRDFDMVKFLIQAGAEIRVRCYGKFFQVGSPVYYGEYPLSFAASTGQKDIVSYLKRHGARVNQDCDMYGNTALHLAVWHDQLDMYDHLVEYCGASEHVRNNRGATPLLLAASLGKLEVFQHIYNKRRKVAWAYGPVTSYSLSLHEIDTVQNSRRMFVPSAIETIVRKGHMHMIDDPLVRTLLNSKWARFAALQFLLQGLLYLVLVLVQTFLVWLHCNPAKFNTSSREALEVCGLLLALLLLGVELGDQAQWTAGVYHRRQLMTANTRYCPPLYPIPGETNEPPHKSKSGFLTRMMGKGAVAEASEPHTGATSSNTSNPQRHCPPGPGAPQHLLQPAQAHAGHAAAGRIASVGEGGRNPWWGCDAVAVEVCDDQQQHTHQGQGQGRPAGAHPAGGSSSGCEVAGPGPVAEGAGSVQFAQVNDAELAGPARVTDQGTGHMGGDMAQRTTPNSALLMMSKQASLPAPRMGGGDDYPPDIVSVGLGGSLKQPLSLQRAPSFFVNPPGAATPLGARTPAGDAMALHGSGSGVLPPGVGLPAQGSTGAGAGAAACELLPSGMAAAGQDALRGSASGTGPGGGMASPARAPATPMSAGTAAAEPLLPEGGRGSGALRPISSGREASLDGMRPSATEIKNRLRGGGGGDYQAGSVQLRRSDGAKAKAEVGGNVPGGGADEADADEREPLHVGGLRGHCNTLVHSLVGYYSRQAQDPITLLILLHILLTIVHFITWAATYGLVGGSGPSSSATRQFDDIVLSLTALTGWASLLYFARGFEFSGQLAVMVELCLVEVAKWCTIYFIFNMGFTLAFYTLLHGTSDAAHNNDPLPEGTPELTDIGTGMIELLRFMYGEAAYATYTSSQFRSIRAVATCCFILYIACVLLLLVSLLTAVILTTYQARNGHAQKVWLLRWAGYVLRAEARMPRRLQQHCRLGEVSYDPAAGGRVYNHVFEVVEEGAERGHGGEEAGRDKELKAVEGLLERLRKDKAGTAGNAKM